MLIIEVFQLTHQLLHKNPHLSLHLSPLCRRPTSSYTSSYTRTRTSAHYVADPRVAPTPVPTQEPTQEPTPQPTAEPTPLNPLHYRPLLHLLLHKNTPPQSPHHLHLLHAVILRTKINKSCDPGVKMEYTAYRCKRMIGAKENCPKSCTICCRDSTDFFQLLRRNSKRVSCNWVRKFGYTDKRCKQAPARQVCAVTCGEC